MNRRQFLGGAALVVLVGVVPSSTYVKPPLYTVCSPTDIPKIFVPYVEYCYLRGAYADWPAPGVPPPSFKAQ